MKKSELRAGAAALFSIGDRMISPDFDPTAFAHSAEKGQGVTLAHSGGAIRIEPGERFAIVGSVAVVPIRGMLSNNTLWMEKYFGWTTYQGLIETCTTLGFDDQVTAVVFDTDSPGGLVLGMEGAGLAIAALSAAKPVHVIAAPLAASAAYWLASQGGEISVAPGGEVGSIGIMTGSNVQVGAGKDGWRTRVITSSHAEAKNPNAETEEGMVEIMRRLDELEARFHSAVASGRGVTVEALLANVGIDGDPKRGGAMFSAERAVEVGLADHVETRAAFYGRILEKYKPERPAPRGIGALRQAQVAVAMAQT